MDLHPIGMDWHFIDSHNVGIGLALKWHWIGIELRWIGIRSTLDLDVDWDLIDIGSAIDRLRVSTGLTLN